jgi:hypothetical protein
MRRTVLLLAVMVSALLMAGCSEPITCPTSPDGECRGTKGADQITGTRGVDRIYALGGDDSVQGDDGRGQRLKPLHLPPPVRLLCLCFVRVSYNNTRCIHCCGGLSCAMVLPLHLGRHERWHGQQNSKIATYSVYLFEGDKEREI